MEEKPDQIWKYKRYGLIIEYHKRTGMAALFMIGSIISFPESQIYHKCIMGIFVESLLALINDF